jgi:hypothetical protein
LIPGDLLRRQGSWPIVVVIENGEHGRNARRGREIGMERKRHILRFRGCDEACDGRGHE